MSSPATLGQVALNLYDYGVRDWYVRVFGFVYAGATDLFFGPTTTRVQGIPKVVERCKWLVDGRDAFQLEFFKFISPRSKPRRIDERLSDVGYGMMGIHVRDFDGVVARLGAEGTPILTEPMGVAGERRACTRDPEGNLVEIFERDPLGEHAPRPVRPEVPSNIRTVTVSVPDLDEFKRRLIEVFDLDDVGPIPLHVPEHERLWGLDGAKRRSAVLRSDGALIELVQYESPAPRPRPDGYRICDQGYMNMAFVLRSVEEFDRVFARAVRAGFRPNGKPLDAGVFKVMYVNDPHGFSIELLYPRRWAYHLTGFLPSIPYVEQEVVIRAPVEKIWETVTDHARMVEWTKLPTELVRPGKTDRNGVGALRKVRVLGSTAEEEVVEFVPNKRMVYRLVGGAPLRDHRGTIVLVPEGAATRVRWAVQFESVIPGAGYVIAAVLGRLFGAALGRLREMVER